MRNTIQGPKSPHFSNIAFLFFCLLLASPMTFGAGGVEETHINKYKNRYELAHSLQKKVDNRGNGYAPLYGVRNFRMVLAGILYRGGANNMYHQTKPRANENPLPEDGLMNLCKQGFKNAVYLYTTNFSTASKTTNCQTLRGADNTLTYHQLNAFKDEGLSEILKLVHNEIIVEYGGPVYSHCWNGWHASGLVAAISLRQFCGVSANEAVRYWDLATDGVNTDPNYEKVRIRIREYKVVEELEIPMDVREKVCPSIEELGLLQAGEKIQIRGSKSASKMMEVKL